MTPLEAINHPFFNIQPILLKPSVICSYSSIGEPTLRTVPCNSSYIKVYSAKEEDATASKSDSAGSIHTNNIQNNNNFNGHVSEPVEAQLTEVCTPVYLAAASHSSGCLTIPPKKKSRFLTEIRIQTKKLFSFTYE